MATTHIDTCIEVCNSLLRGEISAVETYTQAIDKFSDDPAVTALEEIRSNHIESANRLRRSIHEMGGEPSNDSGAWGSFAKTVEGSAKLFGENAALKALIEGEEHGVKEYEDALKNEDVMVTHKEVMRAELLPRQHLHIIRLRALKDMR